MLKSITKPLAVLAILPLLVLLSACGSSGSASTPPTATPAPTQSPITLTPTSGASGNVLFKTLTGHSDAVTSVAYSPDGLVIASGDQDFMVRLWNVTLGVQMAQLPGNTDGVNAVVFSPDGAFLASGGGDKTVRIWKIGK